MVLQDKFATVTRFFFAFGEVLKLSYNFSEPSRQKGEEKDVSSRREFLPSYDGSSVTPGAHSQHSHILLFMRISSIANITFNKCFLQM